MRRVRRSWHCNRRGPDPDPGQMIPEEGGGVKSRPVARLDAAGLIA